MKKIVFMVIALIVLISVTSAVAEEFELRNGIQFGMTLNDVAKIEKNSGYSIEYKTAATGNTDNSQMMFVQVPNLAGIGGEVVYDTDKSGKLNLCWYRFGYEHSQKEIDALIDAYRNKYGEPDISGGYSYIDIAGTAHDAIDYYDEMPSMFKVQVHDIEQWIIPMEDGGAVDIIVMMLKLYSGDLDLHITYSYRTPNEFQKFMSSPDIHSGDI